MSPGLVTDPVRLRVGAKLTLNLRVLGDAGDGYHEIDAVMTSLSDPADVVEVALTGQPEVRLQVAGGAAGVPTDATNLAAQAARVMLRRVEPGAGARVRVRKAIPAGAGLGGGSADAAAVLTAITRLLPTETEGVDLARVGAELGSDVPFCVTGGLARVRGRGEIVEPVESGVADFGVVLAIPPVPVSTAEVYRHWDQLGGPGAERWTPAPRALQVHLAELANDLEPAAVDLHPELAEVRDRFEAAVEAPPILAGSGGAWFAAVDGEEAARADAARQVLGDGLPVVAARPSARSVIALSEPWSEEPGAGPPE